MKKFILIFSLLIFTILFAPSPIFAAKKVEYIRTKVIGNTGYSWVNVIKIDKEGNIYDAGVFQGTGDFDFTGGIDNHTSNGDNDAYITKTNSDGTYAWTKTFGGTGYEPLNGLIFDTEDNIFLSGGFAGTVDFDFTGGIDNHTANGIRDVFVTKINSDGTYGWTKTFGGTGWDTSLSMNIDNLSNIYICGYYSGTVDFDFTEGVDNHTSNGGEDIYLTKITTNGTYGYTKTFGGIENDSCWRSFIDTSNNIYLTGGFAQTVDFDFTVGIDNHISNGSYDIYLTRINSDGTYGYTKTIGGTGWDASSGVATDSLNNIYLTGSFVGTVDFDFAGGTDNHTSNGGSDIFITKINSDGTYGYTKTFGGTGWDWGSYIALDSFNNIYITGSFGSTVDFDPGIGVVNKTTSSYYDEEAFVASYTSIGSYRWVKTLNASISSDGFSLAVANNRIYLGGSCSTTVDFNPDGPPDIKICSSGGSAILTSYQLYYPGLTLTESSGTTSIVPNISTDTVSLKLDAEPDSNVTVSLGSSDGSLTYSPSSLTFSSANYATPQTVTISSGTPLGSNTTKNMTFTLTSSDTDYNGLSVTSLSVGVNVDNSDTTAPNKVVITNIGNISKIPNKDILRYYFTSQTPTIKGTSEANSTVYFVVNGHTYSTTTGSDGKYSINLNTPSLLREKNVIVYYAKDSYFNKSVERTLELTVGEENFPSQSSSSSSSISTSSETSLTSSTSSSTSSLSSSSTSSASSSRADGIEIIEATKEITIKDENGNVIKNTVVTINGKTYTTDSKGKVKAEVAGIYVIEYYKGGVKYASTIKSSESIATLKSQSTPNILIYIFLCMGSILVLGILVLFIKRRKNE